MSALTIPARDVADSVGLPDWLDFDALYERCENTYLGGYPDDRVEVFHHGMRTVCNVLGNRGVLPLRDRPDIAFGVALKLDEWERAGGRTTRWSVDLAGLLWAPVGRLRTVRLQEFTRAMIARIQHIARDHRFRRSLGWTVEPGTLMELQWVPADDAWLLRGPNGELTGRGSKAIPALAGITDPAEALAAIDAEVSP